MTAASTLSSAAGAPAFPALHRRLTPTMITTAGIGLPGTGWLLVGTAAGVAQVAAGLLVGGLGIGLVVPNLNLRLSETAHPHRRGRVLSGRVLSGLVTGILLGQFLSPLAVQPLIQNTGIAAAFTWTGTALAAAAALTAITALPTRTGPDRNTPSPTHPTERTT